MDELIPVLTMAGDGPIFILHTPAEYARLMRGVDIEASWLMAAELNVED